MILQSTPPRLGQRLALIESLVPKGNRLIDVGSDHALLPIAHLLKHPKASAVAIDNKEKPLAVAAKNRQRFALEDRLTLLLADGLPDNLLTAGDTVVIAGMGGVEILRILEAAKTFPDTLILSPHSRAEMLRAGLQPLGLSIRDEHVVQEGRRAYVVMEIEKKALAKPLTALECWIGPVIYRKLQEGEMTPALSLYLGRLIKHLENREVNDPTIKPVRETLLHVLGES